MSSLRNAVKRITHKERSQPTKRQHLGLLEKKKDYKVRAKDYHQKQNVLTSLRRKAAQRNPDEFYFGMKNSTVRNGKHRLNEEAKAKLREDEIGADAVKLMKSQDLTYVRMQTMKDAKKIERLQASLHYLGSQGGGDHSDDYENERDSNIKHQRKHTVFVENQEQAKNFDVATHFDTLPELAGRAFNRPRKETLLKLHNEKYVQLEYDDEYYGDDDAQKLQNSIKTEKVLKKQHKLEKLQARKLSKARSSAYAEMEARKKRLVHLKNAEAHLQTEKILASKGRKRKIQGEDNGKPAIYKFRKKRAK
mmetsp:Transcript_32033/g.37350  ORF Transcript_32033/g.37350 Transcript_32033/m.37350 type:complete len:306 (-) Transcript_32033:213-1130(-)